MAVFPTPGAPRRTTLTRSEGPWSPCPQLSDVAGGLSSETCQSVWVPPLPRKSGKDQRAWSVLRIDRKLGCHFFKG